MKLVIVRKRKHLVSLHSISAANSSHSSSILPIKYSSSSGSPLQEQIVRNYHFYAGTDRKSWKLTHLCLWSSDTSARSSVKIILTGRRAYGSTNRKVGKTLTDMSSSRGISPLYVVDWWCCTTLQPRWVNKMQFQSALGITESRLRSESKRKKVREKESRWQEAKSAGFRLRCSCCALQTWVKNNSTRENKLCAKHNSRNELREKRHVAIDYRNQSAFEFGG